VDERDLVEEPLRRVEVADQRRLVLLGLAEGLDQGRLAAGVDDLVVEAEPVDDPLVARHERRIAVEQLALVAGLRRLEQVGVLVQVVPVGDVRILLGHPRRHVPADDAVDAGAARVDGDLLVGDVGLGEVGVAPVLEDGIDGAALEAFP
jgi:hypothetical protein